MKIQVLVFMSEIKCDLTLKKIKFSVSLMLLFTIIKLLHALRLSRQKTNFFFSHFTSIWSCSVCFGGLILGENTVVHLENEPKIAFKAIKHKESAQKKCRSHRQPA